MSAAAVRPPFEQCVFVNCPFDDDYLPLLHAMIFAIHDCGFVARLAIEDTGGAELRLDKIVRIIGESCYSIHDVSRVQLTASSGLPRFNMPFEAGLALGALRYGTQGPKRRDFLLLDAVEHQDKQTLSDLAGQDAKAHGNDAKRIVAAVRAFLSAKSGRGVNTRGAEAIWSRYERFRRDLPRRAKRASVSETEIVTFDYLGDWTSLMGEWLATGRR